jgi:tRNA1(Val) A37 N6-methylase TrmN6
MRWLTLFLTDLVKDRTVLELGCGTGLVGIVVAQIQLTTSLNRSSTDTEVGERERNGQEGNMRSRGSVTMTDMNLSVLERCKGNVYLPPSKLSPLSGFDDNKQLECHP